MKRITLKETELVNLIKRVINEQSFQYTPNTQGDPSFQHWQCAMMVNMGCNVNCSGAGNYRALVLEAPAPGNSISSSPLCDEVCSPEFYDLWTANDPIEPHTPVGIDRGHRGPKEDRPLNNSMM